MKDCFGKDLHVGDVVVWTGKKGSGPIQCTVKNIMYGKACIEEVDEPGRHITHWVTSVNVIKCSGAEQNKSGENLNEGDKVVFMYLGWGRENPEMGIGTVKSVGTKQVTVYPEDGTHRWWGRIDKAGKQYLTLDKSRVCKLYEKWVGYY